ncbi:hypothetical protein DEO72_LG7g2395 [Vigna unguiculata]|uniref:Uncharacterized protein n=1 Tax=Vigna unguiculata TaxID=3917 RepID=A0A4D6MI54_VIGUN|nr:hypothetical protein DEO72_LG7g2395 [Vigna unguiculata]
MSQDYQTRHSHTKEGNLSGPIRTSHNSHTHTGNTRQPEPQLKSSSCSSIILSHNSRDVILSLAGDTYRQAPSASEHTNLQTSLGGTTYIARRYALQNPTIFVAIAWQLKLCLQALHLYNE